MCRGVVRIYYGDGHGKSTAALGKAVRAAAAGKNVVMIQFLKEKMDEGRLEFYQKLEPELKVFRFAKSEESFEELSEEEQQEEIMNLKNGFNYGKKVVSSDACDLLILDEVLGLIDRKLLEVEDLISLLESKPENMSIILTGRILDERLFDYADEICKLVAEKTRLMIDTEN